MHSKSQKPRGIARFRHREVARVRKAVPDAVSIEVTPAGAIIAHLAPVAAPPSPSENPWDPPANAEKRPA